MSEHTRHFAGLDGLRGVAAFIVVFLHGTLFIKNADYSPPAACMAVDFFFMLSGFVIARAYDERLQQMMTWRQFMAVRLIRLYPMLFFGTAMGGVLFVVSQHHDHQFHPSVSMLITIGSFVLLPVGLGVATVAYPLNIAAWSLFFEFAVNALYGSGAGRMTNRHLAAFVAVSGLALVPMAVWGGPYIQIGFGNPTAFLLGFVRVTYPFWAGVLLFRVFPVHVLPSMPVGVAGVVLALALLAPVDNPGYDLTLVLVLFPVIVVFGASARPGGRTARACSALGRLSYPLYLIHVPVFLLTTRLVRRAQFGISPWLQIAGGAVVSVIAAIVLLIAFDEPIRRRLSAASRWYNRDAALKAG
jgi:peptidoglycan/LPS O-acetylase OafA/YrhL